MSNFSHQFKIGGVRKQTTWSFGLRNMVGNDSNVVGNESTIEGKDKSLVGNYSNKEGYDANLVANSRDANGNDSNAVNNESNMVGTDGKPSRENEKTETILDLQALGEIFKSLLTGQPIFKIEQRSLREYDEKHFQIREHEKSSNSQSNANDPNLAPKLRKPKLKRTEPPTKIKFRCFQCGKKYNRLAKLLLHRYL